MGRLLEIPRNPLEAIEGSPAQVVVPELPWEVRLDALSVETAMALEAAAHETGRLNDSLRSSKYYQQAYCALASIEALSSARLLGEKTTWVGLGRAMVADARDPFRFDGPASVALLACMLGPHSTHSWHAYLSGLESELLDDHLVPPRFVAGLRNGLDAWLCDGAAPALVKAALVTMSVAATRPESPQVAAVARMVFGPALGIATDSWGVVPLSWGFLAKTADWPLVAQALAQPDGTQSERVDAALGEVLRAAARAAWSAHQIVDGVTYRPIRCGNAEVHRWLPAQKGTVPHLFSAVHALPAATPEMLARLLDISVTGAKRAITTLEERGLVRTEREPRTRKVLSVTANPRWNPWIEVVDYYPPPRLFTG